jgi:hypothetical protein
MTSMSAGIAQMRRDSAGAAWACGIAIGSTRTSVLDGSLQRHGVALAPRSP